MTTLYKEYLDKLMEEWTDRVMDIIGEDASEAEFDNCFYDIVRDDVALTMAAATWCHGCMVGQLDSGQRPPKITVEEIQRNLVEVRHKLKSANDEAKAEALAKIDRELERIVKQQRRAP